MPCENCIFFQKEDGFDLKRENHLKANGGKIDVDFINLFGGKCIATQFPVYVAAGHWCNMHRQADWFHDKYYPNFYFNEQDAKRLNDIIKEKDNLVISLESKLAAAKSDARRVVEEKEDVSFSLKRQKVLSQEAEHRVVQREAEITHLNAAIDAERKSSKSCQKQIDALRKKLKALEKKSDAAH